MDLEALRNSPIGTIVPIKGTDAKRGEYEYYAYSPEPLPESVSLSSATWATVVEASTAIAKLDAAARHIPEPALLRRTTLKREAQSTSALEGTFAAFTDLLEADLGDGQQNTPEITEVRNYERAGEQAFEWVPERHITRGMLEALQGTLVRNTKAEALDAGRIRERQVVIGQGGSISDSRFIPPPNGDTLVNGVEALITWMNAPSPLPPIVRAALAHYQFETLHPFADGNGRIGRLLIVLQLMQYGALRDPVLIVSPWFEARRPQYQDALLRLSQTGDFDAWVQFFSTGLHAQANATAERIEALLDFQNRMRELAHQEKLRGVGARIAENLIGQPIVTPTWASKQYGVSYQAANNGIERLVSLGVLREMTGRTYGRLFAAGEVLDLIEPW